MKSTPQEQSALRVLAHKEPRAYVRLKALAMLRVLEGRTQGEVAEFFDVSQRSVNRWLKGFHEEGVSSLFVKPGRGRRAKADPGELASYIKQSPRNFGLPQTRWTLRALAKTVPSLKDFTDAGVYYALQRAGYSFKRGQPTLHSP